MKLTVFFIHHGDLMKFEVWYSPVLDRGTEEGIWNLDDNTVAMSWRLFSDFRKEKDYSRRRLMLDSITKISRYQLGQ
ncbi:MAG: hypothetical protein H0W62_11525 [Chitinophagales bacterium]|nr:hypothetical protein [Chitinophagales bacterium]